MDNVILHFYILVFQQKMDLLHFYIFVFQQMMDNGHITFWELLHNKFNMKGLYWIWISLGLCGLWSIDPGARLIDIQGDIVYINRERWQLLEDNYLVNCLKKSYIKKKSIYMLLIFN